MSENLTLHFFLFFFRSQLFDSRSQVDGRGDETDPHEPQFSEDHRDSSVENSPTRCCGVGRARSTSAVCGEDSRDPTLAVGAGRTREREKGERRKEGKKERKEERKSEEKVVRQREKKETGEDTRM